MKIIFIVAAAFMGLSFTDVPASFLNSSAQTTPYEALPAIQDTGIIEKYWKLVSLNQVAVTNRDPRQSEPHMILKSFKKEVRGNGGCNSFSATYELQEGNKIAITPFEAGENSCKNSRTERQFFKFLVKADKYEVKGDSLTMQDATGKLTAKFEAVYF